ncbi:MAG: flagellar export chaperone FliS [Terracidiphilus sp.]|nr:flagellar export chaperone FliS [Terracidiphilus sp.]
MNPYQTCAFEGASAVELTVALYDGIIRFMNLAIDAVERGDTSMRRTAVKRAMDIVIHLQATLKMDIGGEPAKALADFYVAMFALMLQGSQANSRQKFEQVIACVRNVRGAWRQAAKESGVNHALPQMADLPSGSMHSEFEAANYGMESARGLSWNA